MSSKDQAVKAFFDQTELYLHKEFGVAVRALIAEDLLGAAIRKGGKELIDLGCGNGDVSLPFLPLVKTHHFLDISEEMLKLVEAKIPPHQEGKTAFFQGDLESLRLPQKYDFVIAFGLIMHVNSPKDSLQKMADLLKDDGQLLVQFTNYRHLISRFNKFFRKKTTYELNAVDTALFESLVGQLGLKITEKHKYSLLFSGLGFLPNRWLFKFHWWTYRNFMASRLGMDEVYVLTKK